MGICGNNACVKVCMSRMGFVYSVAQSDMHDRHKDMVGPVLASMRNTCFCVMEYGKYCKTCVCGGMAENIHDL